MTTAAPADRWWAAGLLVPVVLAGLFSLARIAAERDDVPRDEDYAAAAEVVAAWGFSTSTDALSVLPPWSLRPHEVLKRYRPVSGDALHERPLERYARLFVVVEPDADRYLDPLIDRLGEPAARERRGRVEVLRFDLGEPRVVFDLAAALPSAEVKVTKGGSEVMRCDRSTKGGLACRGGKGWQRVTREHLLVSENGRLAVWSHPPAPGEVLELTWRDVPIADVLVLEAGHTRTGADAAKAPVDVEVLVGEERLARLSYAPRFAFTAKRLDTKAFAGQKRDVTLRVSSKDHGRNHWAFDAFTAREGGR